VKVKNNVTICNLAEARETDLRDVESVNWHECHGMYLVSTISILHVMLIRFLSQVLRRPHTYSKELISLAPKPTSKPSLSHTLSPSL
jgi:hypothetical protein